MGNSIVLYPQIPKGSFNHWIYDKNYSSISYHVWYFAWLKNIYTFFTGHKCFSVCGAWWNHLPFFDSISESGRCDRIKTND